MSFFPCLGAPLHAPKMPFSLIIFITFPAAFRTVHIPFLLHAEVGRLTTDVSICINSNIGSEGTFALNLLEQFLCDDSGVHVVADAPVTLPIVFEPAFARKACAIRLEQANVTGVLFVGQNRFDRSLWPDGFPVGVRTPLRSSSRFMFKAAGNPLYSHMSGNLRRC